MSADSRINTQKLFSLSFDVIEINEAIEIHKGSEISICIGRVMLCVPKTQREIRKREFAITW